MNIVGMSALSLRDIREMTCCISLSTVRVQTPQPFHDVLGEILGYETTIQIDTASR